MKKFTSFITEQKNTHMEHLEDAVLNGGVDGARQAINMLRSMRDMLAGNSKAAVNSTVKWDGAPAIFAGIDPTDGKFFVAKKGIFNKNPKVYKTPADIDADTKGDLATKLKEALKYLPALGIKGVVQGDFLYSKSDLRTETIDGEKCVTFQPNTIVYAVPLSSPLAREIRAAKLGIVWHTTYEGKSFETMKASFGKDIATKLKKTKTVFSTDANFRDVSGKATFTAKETAEITSVLSRAGKVFNTIDSSLLNGISDDDFILLRTKTYMNTLVRAGEKFPKGSTIVTGLYNYIDGYFDKEIASKKSEKGKETWRAKKVEAMKFFANNSKADIAKVFDLMNLIIEAKLLVIKKMDTASSMGTFLRTNNGMRVTAPEGYVAIDKIGSALKLVDRLEFSKANFSPDIIKGWQR